MNYNQFTHALRSITSALDVYEVIVIGSQSILGIYPTPHEDLLVSNEVDFIPVLSEEQLKQHDFQYYLDYIDGVFGQHSQFFKTYGYYVDGCEMATATLPVGWEERLVPLQGRDTDLKVAKCLEPHDLAVAKLAAFRDKDVRYVKVLLKEKMIDVKTLKERMQHTPRLRSDQLEALIRWINGQQKQLKDSELPIIKPRNYMEYSADRESYKASKPKMS